MPILKTPTAEPLPGYRLLEPLGQGGYGEVWKCLAPGGLHKAIKFVHGNLTAAPSVHSHAHVELQAIERIKGIRHPFLLSIERVECVQGELLIVTELADGNLHQLWQQQRRVGQPGIARTELLLYLRGAAEVLDLLHDKHQLQHLDVKPQNLLTVAGYVKVADFGLVSGMGAKQALQLAGITPLYAAPELFQGDISRHCDQYSLAIVYQELLTGAFPYLGKNARHLLLQHTTAEPDLRALSPADQAIVGRALAKDPQQRFSSCQELVAALEQATSATVAVAVETVPAPPPMNTETCPALSPPITPPPGTQPGEPVYRPQQRLSTNALMDVWLAEAGGQQYVLKTLYAPGARAGSDHSAAVRRLQALQHPILPRQELLDDTPGKMLLATEWIEATLRERLQHYQALRAPGIPRDELLKQLLPIAEGLDFLYRQHALQHLTLTPRSILLARGGPMLGDFGLAQLFWLPTGQNLAAYNSRYAAPELSRGQLSPSCDQYSLALIYHELLTGMLLPRRDPAAPHSLTPSSLEGRAHMVLARALDGDPARRWPSCTAFLRALSQEGLATMRMTERSLAFVASTPRPASRLQPPTHDAQLMLTQWLSDLGAGLPLAPREGPPHLDSAGQTLHCQLTVNLPLGAARLQLDSVRERFLAQVLHEDERSLVFRIGVPTDFLRSWLGQKPGLEVNIQLARYQPLMPTPIRCSVRIATFDCKPARARELLESVGQEVLAALGHTLQSTPNRRQHTRVLWPSAIQVYATVDGAVRGDAVACRGKDLALGGAGFFMPGSLPSPEVFLKLSLHGGAQPICIPASVVRAQRLVSGWYDTGVLFHLNSTARSQPTAALQPATT